MRNSQGAKGQSGELGGSCRELVSFQRGSQDLHCESRRPPHLTTTEEQPSCRIKVWVGADSGVTTNQTIIRWWFGGATAESCRSKPASFGVVKHREQRSQPDLPSSCLDPERHCSVYYGNDTHLHQFLALDGHGVGKCRIFNCLRGGNFGQMLVVVHGYDTGIRNQR